AKALTRRAARAAAACTQRRARGGARCGGREARRSQGQGLRRRGLRRMRQLHAAAQRHLPEMRYLRCHVGVQLAPALCSAAQLPIDPEHSESSAGCAGTNPSGGGNSNKKLLLLSCTWGELLLSLARNNT